MIRLIASRRILVPKRALSRPSRTFHFQQTFGDAPTPTEIAPLLDEYAHHPARPLTLSTLLSFGRPVSPQSVLDSVGYVLSEVPRMFGWRVRAFEELPFIVGMNPFVARILAAHRRSFKLLATYPPVTDLEDNARFTAQLEALVQAHANDIPIMAKGFQECSKYLTSDEISTFLDAAIRNRIAVRLLAEQHIAISRDLAHPELATPDHIGVVHMRCSPAAMIRMCSSFVSELCEATLGTYPEVIIDGDADATFAYIPVHVEYILTEILKNAFRASVERSHVQGLTSPPPINITIASPPPPLTFVTPLSEPPSTHVNSHPALLTLRIRDAGGGVSPAHLSQIFSYSFTTARSSPYSDEDDDEDGGPYAAQSIGGMAGLYSNSMHTKRHYSGDHRTDNGGGLFAEIVSRGVQGGMGTIAGLGYGLPMSRLYAKYFGGSLEFVSLDGWGSDVFVKLRCLDQAGEVEI